jgi:hypothetical protein
MGSQNDVSALTFPGRYCSESSKSSEYIAVGCINSDFFVVIGDCEDGEGGKGGNSMDGGSTKAGSVRTDETGVEVVRELFGESGSEPKSVFL